MSTAHASTISRVIAIPELLDMVFQFLDDASNASNARVSKRWSELALDVLWRDVVNLRRLFTILSPLQRSGSSYKFTRPLESNDWVRFERYRRRVRKLSYQGTKAQHPLHHSVFDDIARSRTTLDIFPNMRSLEWDAPLTLCVIFMHKNLKSLALFLNPDASRVFEDNTTSVARVFEDIVSRMPKVSELDLRFQFPVREIEEGLVKLCSSLLDLRSITLPRFCLTTKLAESLSQLSNLQTIDFQYFDYQGYGDSLDISNFEPVLSEGCFTSLWELSLTISFDDAVKFLTIPFFPSNLTILFIDSPSIEDPTAVQALTSAVPDVCPLLKELTLISFVEPHMPFNSPPKKEECINIDAFRPLFKCPNLTSFELEHHYPLHLDLADVEEIATSWPAIEVLSLNTQPVYAEHTNLTLRALLPFARHCPKLQRLGMFLHATITDFPTADQASVYQLPPFRALHTLSMGVSPIEEEGSVALFLSQICPLDCVIEKGVTWNDRDLAPDDILDTVYERFGKWKKVEELLPLLTKLRIEERERAQLLKKEVQDLRIRTEILMDKFALSGAPVDGCITL